MGVEPKLIRSGSGWRVYRVGRSSCIQLDRTDGTKPAEVWMRAGANDITRSALLGALVAGTHGAVDHQSAAEAMQADW